MSALGRFSMESRPTMVAKTTAIRRKLSPYIPSSLFSVSASIRRQTPIVRRALHSLQTKRSLSPNCCSCRHLTGKVAPRKTPGVVRHIDAPEAGWPLMTQAGRIIYAFGIVYLISEYGIELTICEGPSMLTTIKPQGEIILLDRFTPRWFGLQGGSIGKHREFLARKRQREHERQCGEEGKVDGRFTWHEKRVPVNRLPSEGVKDRFVNQIFSGISVGDVVVVRHPDRVGTVCKRVLGLPGDIVSKPTRRTKKEGILDRSLKDNQVVPDGHLWIEGDNPWNSSDSRIYGSVPASLIVGRVLFRVWPVRGKAIMERGARPEQDDDPQFSFSGSVVFPAGYDNQIIIRDQPME